MVGDVPADTMARSLTLKNLPDDLYGRLRKSAQQHRRSLNNEAIVCLEVALPAQEITAAERLEQIRTLRRSLPMPAAAYTPDQIDAFKREGRA
jgi:plasmid stability protein